MEQKLARMKELAGILKNASKAYYQEDREIMSNYEYDALYDELEKLEKETGTVLNGSPTVSVGYEALDALPKEAHESPMLSLDKTKEREVLREFIGNQKVLLSWKLDGLTIVFTYENGRLSKAVTRGNGTIGEVVTNNAKTFVNIPMQIPYKGKLILRGEAVITYSDFEKINAEIKDIDAKYKNPRNLCSGSVRQLSNEVTAKRNVRFYAFGLVSAENVDFKNSREQQMIWLKNQGFDTVEYKVITSDMLDEALDYYANAIETNDIPSDGLVSLYDDIAYGDSLGRTAKYPRNSFAFKWADEIKETTLLEIEWSPSRTGLINPVAIFEPVELEGTTVSRASVHNISQVKELQLGIGDKIKVYKANMIIPQIEENITRSGNLAIPNQCPACGGKAEIKNENDVETLYCMNPKCPVKKIKAFSLFVSRDAMNIEGLSESTLEKFIAHGFVRDFADLFELEQHKEQIVAMDRYGEKSFENLLNSIEKAKTTSAARVLGSLGIANVGFTTAKVICKSYGDDLNKIQEASEEELAAIDSVGPIIAKGIREYFADEQNCKQLHRILEHVVIEREENDQEQIFADKTFVITGSVNHFANRSDAKAFIESYGGKVTGSVTKKTNYLVNNDTTSQSSKN
ncbi:MAG: NAD-dependent DNA ligase LigA, partial [Eubacteriales bacterium]|nr:NAD-dependent DNA ligase LigA [Eubacteriales bacterium]